jgi:PAS domain S-box-containing protein
MVQFAPKGKRMDIVSKMKRQRPWVLLATAVGIAVVIALARVSSPGESMPLPLSLFYWALAMAIAATIIQIAYGRAIGMATELANSNGTLQTEIVKRKGMEEALRESEEHYRSLFEDASDAIATLLLDGTITGVNHGLETLLGWSREELIGQHFREFLPPSSIALVEERVRRFQAGEKVSQIYDIELIGKDGRVVPVEARVRFFRDKDGKPIGVQAISRDVSARKALEQQQTDFLAMLTHDIRNPLEVILGYGEMLLDEARERNAPREMDMLLRLMGSALTVRSLVTNYLDFSKIEAGHLSLSTKPLALNNILRQVGEQYENEARRCRIDLRFQLQEELPAVWGDALALERVFANLLHNALKFTPDTGQITIRSAQHNGEVVATITDTGPGVTPEEMPVLFEKYRQAGTSRHREGAGLGLFIVKSLVDAHGGRVEVESTLDVGSCFSVFLPVAATE